MRKIFPADKATALLDLEQTIREHYRPGIEIELILAASDFSRTYRLWQKHQQSISRDLRTEIAISVTRGKQSAHHELIMHREGIMHAGNIWDGFQAFFGITSDDRSLRPRPSTRQNPLLAALADEIQVKESDVWRPFLRSSLYVTSITITPRTQADANFILPCLQSEKSFREGIIRFINEMNNKYVKASSDLKLIVEEPGFGFDPCEMESPYGIKLTLSETERQNRAHFTAGTCGPEKKELHVPLQVTVVDGSAEPLQVMVTHVPCRINRLSSAEIQITTSRYISKNHLVMDLAPDGNLIISDLGSTNGSFINGLDIRRKNHKLGLDETVVIDLGLGSSPEVIQANLAGQDHSQFPQLIITYGEPSVNQDHGTPEPLSPDYEGTPEPFNPDPEQPFFSRGQ